MKRGSWEATAWVENFRFKRKLPGIIRWIYDLVIMIRISRTFDDESLFAMRENMNKKKIKMFRTLDMAILKMQEKRGRMREEKEYYIRMQNYENASSIKQIEDVIAEEERLINLTPEERAIEALREVPYRDRIDTLPISWVQQNCKVKEQHTDQNGVTYIIYEKVYQHYIGIVYSPRRKKPSGNQGFVFCAGKTWEEIKQIVKEQYNKERGFIPLEQFIGEDKPKKKKTPDISHVRRAMGLTEQDRRDRGLWNDDLDGDIF